MTEDIQKKEAYEQLTDEQLISRLREKKEQEITDYLMDKYKNLVRKHANVLFLIGGDTDDLIQEGMIGLFKAIRDFDILQESSFYHFAEICITRQMYTAVETSRRKKHAPLNSYISLSASYDETGNGKGDWLESLLLFPQMNPEQMMIDEENMRHIKQHLDEKLSALEKQVLQYHLKGAGYVQIAQILGKSPKSIDNALQRIRNKVNDIL